ncbi:MULTISPECIES: hypothetical protein [Pseudoalteromonas]|mgnify:FL=1|uniref:Uncharacterized protein n=1 Tax=Pseudoalteromonas gelatinilytica TaxID=1703256 RepID=A0A3A3EFW1_9GAMM|nr:MULTISPECIES: hypothetical protein [Pseudoalteromonas]RJF34037.1 hypothetical protein D4741_16315 [Pseudoalteromonas profundi]TMO26973.1 hypothetical protein CWC28_12145 [Pseudoalteromonas sp. S4492]
MNLLENYLLSLQVNTYNTSISQVIEIQTRIWQSIHSGSSYAQAMLEVLEVVNHSPQQQHQALLKQVLQLLGYSAQSQVDNNLLIAHKRFSHVLNLS